MWVCIVQVFACQSVCFYFVTIYNLIFFLFFFIRIIILLCSLANYVVWCCVPQCTCAMAKKVCMIMAKKIKSVMNEWTKEEEIHHLSVACEKELMSNGRNPFFNCCSTVSVITDSVYNVCSCCLINFIHVMKNTEWMEKEEKNTQ